MDSVWAYLLLPFRLYQLQLGKQEAQTNLINLQSCSKAEFVRLRISSILDLLLMDSFLSPPNPESYQFQINQILLLPFFYTYVKHLFFCFCVEYLENNIQKKHVNEYGFTIHHQMFIHSNDLLELSTVTFHFNYYCIRQ